MRKPDPFEAMADRDDHSNAHLAQAEIHNCTICDHEGYRPNGTVCDHTDRTDTVTRGRALVQAELDKIRQRKQSGAA